MRVSKGRAIISVVLTIIVGMIVATPAMAAQSTSPTNQALELTVGDLDLIRLQSRMNLAGYCKETSIEGSLARVYSEDLSIRLTDAPQKHLDATSNLADESHPDSTAVVEQKHTKTISKRKSSTIEAELGLSLGYRVDDLDWNIAGDINGNNPNILSELSWNNLESFQIKARAKTILLRSIYLRGTLGYGWILNGEVQDSDYLGDDRTLEFSRSNNNADKGELLDASIGVGYQFSFALDRFEFGLIPLLGYSYHEQNLTLTDGFQTIPPLGPFPDLDSRYETEWAGPWIGLEFIAKPSKKLSLSITYEYHWADYYAEADWNLRTDFAHPKSFEHEANGEGQIIALRWQYVFATPWALYLDFNYEDWSTDPGIDRIFFSNGTITETRLNEVNWKSFALMLGAAYRF